MRGRKSLLALVLTASVAIPAGVAGQGVPVGDLKKIALEVLGLREEAAKTKAEQDKNENGGAKFDHGSGGMMRLRAA